MSVGTPDDVLFQTRFLDRPTISSVFIPTYSSSSRHTVYHVKVLTPVATWVSLKRYKEFSNLHSELLSQYPSLDGSLFPPKKTFGNTSMEFVQKRQDDLEHYLQYLIQTLIPPPPALLEFLDYHLYDVATTVQRLSHVIQKTADEWLKDDRVVHITPIQLHCVTKQLTLPDDEAGSVKYDLGYLYDFLYQLNRVKISPMHSADIVLQEAVIFDLSVLKSATAILMDNFNIQGCHGIDTLRPHLKRLEIHRCITSMKEFFCRRTVSFQETVLEDPTSLAVRSNVWKCLNVLDLRFNNLTEIDPSMALLPNLEDLVLSHNKISTIENLSELCCLMRVDLSHNEIEIVDDLHVRIGNVKSINLASNRLHSLRGFRRMYSLEELNLKANSLCDVSEVCHLGALPNLKNLTLKDNPLSQSDFYHIQVLAALKSSYPEVLLDGLKPSKGQLERLEVLRLTNPLYFGINPPSPSEAKKKVHPKPVSIVAPGEEEYEDTDFSLQDSLSVRERIHKMRQEGGEKWLSMLSTDKNSPRTNKKDMLIPSSKVTPKSSPKIIKKRNVHTPQDEATQSADMVSHDAPAVAPKALFPYPQHTPTFVPTLQPVAEKRPEASGPVVRDFFSKSHLCSQPLSETGETLKFSLWGSVILYDDPLHLHDSCVLVSDRTLHIWEFHKSTTTHSWVNPDALPLRHLLDCPLNSIRSCSVGITRQAIRIETSSSKLTFSIICYDVGAVDSMVQCLQPLTSIKDTADDDLLVLKTQIVQKPLVLSGRYFLTASLEIDDTWKEKRTAQIAEDISMVDVRLASFVSQLNIVEGSHIPNKSLSSERHLVTLISTDDTVYICSSDVVHHPIPDFSDVQATTPQFLAESSFHISSLREVQVVNKPYTFNGLFSCCQLYPVTLSFESATDTVYQKWEVYSHSTEEQERIVQALKQVYTAHTSEELVLSQLDTPGQSFLISRSHCLQSVVQLLSELHRHSSEVLNEYFKATFAMDHKSEEFREIYRTYYIPHSASDKQFEVLVWFSSAALYVVSCKDEAERWIQEKVASNVRISLAHSRTTPLHLLTFVPVSDVREVNVGLFDLSLRITAKDSPSTFTLVTMDDALTERIISFFKSFQISGQGDSASDSLPKIAYPELDFPRLQACLNALSKHQKQPLEDSSIPTVLSYLLVQSEKECDFKSTTSHTTCTQTLVLTSRCLYVLYENYVLWPVPSFSTTLPKGDKFAVEEFIRIDNIVKVEVSNSASCDFTIVCLVGLGSLSSQQSADDEKLVGHLMDSIVLHKEIQKVQAAANLSPPPESFQQFTYKTGTFAQREKFLSVLRDQWENVHYQELPILLKRV